MLIGGSSSGLGGLIGGDNVTNRAWLLSNDKIVELESMTEVCD